MCTVSAKACIGVAVGKVVKLGRLPVKVQLAGQYMPIDPDNDGQEWNIQVQVPPCHCESSSRSRSAGELRV
jgi:hypothetical protein